LPLNKTSIMTVNHPLCHNRPDLFLALGYSYNLDKPPLLHPNDNYPAAIANFDCAY
jgi:hypothetical protein